MKPLTKKAAKINVRRFVVAENEVADPSLVPIWELIYPPKFVSSLKVENYAVHFDNSPVAEGHVYFKDWGGYKCWWLYLNPERWGSPAEQALIRLLVARTPPFYRLQIRCGTTLHHQSLHQFMTDLNFSEGQDERITVVEKISSTTLK